MSGKRILFISYDGMTDPLGQSQVIPYMKGLSRLGHNITIVSAEKENRFNATSSEIKSQLDAANISWDPVLFSNKIPGWSAIGNYRRLIHEAKKVCRENKREIVHCRGYIPSLIGMKLKNEFGVKMIFDMRGFWADERVEGGSWNLRNPLFKMAYDYFKKKEKQFLAGSDSIVSLTENAKREILSWRDLKLPPKKITVIPCCADLDLFSEKNVNAEKESELRRQFNIQQGDFILTYVGSIGTWYLLDEMLRFFKVLRRKSGCKISLHHS